jgi:hypothetical protein
MKKTTILFLAILFTVFTSCEKRNQNDSYQWGNDNMTRVQSYDSNGRMIEYFIAYSMYNNLMNRGGQNAVDNYYYHNRSAIDRNYSRYKSSYTNYTRTKAIAEKKKSILSAARNKQRAKNTVSKSTSFTKSKSYKPSISFKNSSSGRSSFKSSSFRKSSSSRRK